ncbi:MAG: hypothetical protein ACE5IC_03230 [Candidatus Brocadiales bacterium]
MRLSEKIQQKLEEVVKEMDPNIKVGSPSLNFQDFRIDAPIWIKDERKVLEIPKEFIDNFFDTATFDQEVKGAINDLKTGSAKRIRVTDKGRTIIE